MAEKGVVIIICEGISDKVSIELPLKDFLRKNNSLSKLQFYLFSGDIAACYDKKTKQFLPSFEVIDRIESSISGCIDELKPERVYPGDIVAVATLSDLDGCYVDDSSIVYDANSTDVEYDLASNLLKTNDRPFIIERNECKRSSF